jgi:condensin complex subunit 2
LIDYFHDMSLLKEGDGVNFQRASCTLDGCVKIYTSRVDSVATDTGKLLSGLTENKKKRKGDAEDDGDGEDEEGEEGEDGQKRRRRRAQRSAETTLATSYEQLQNKKMDLEFSVDPLFKKASADFDEGGAKGLLLNHLAIDATGRIVFDSSDDAQDASATDRGITPAPDQPGEDTELEEAGSEDVEIDLSGLAARYFPDLARLDKQDICPSLKTFDLGDASSSLDLPFLKAPDDWRQDDKDGDEAGERSGLFLDDENPMGFDDDDAGMAALDLPLETGFGEGGEVWAREAARDPQARVHLMGVGNMHEEGAEGEEEGGLDTEGPQYGLAVSHGRQNEQENILSYFDNALKKNWAGPEHWRIRRIKEAGKAPPPTKRKEKTLFEIDFAAPMTQPLADALYTPATSKSTITLPKAQWKSKTRNLLPDDKHFNSKNLVCLFLKPKARVGRRRSGATQPSHNGRDDKINGEVDEGYWAQQATGADPATGDEEAAQGNYNADFFQDDGLGQLGAPFGDDDDNFDDARDHFSPQAEDVPGQTLALDGVVAATEEGAFGEQLVAQSRRFRPEYVQYARVAKKVDVRRLKEELWRGIGFEDVRTPTYVDCLQLLLTAMIRSHHPRPQKLWITLHLKQPTVH